MSKRQSILSLYEKLISRYGPQGWWPILSKANKKGFDEKGYHPSLYDYPKSKLERYEIVVGSILTQNTAWKNVEKALLNLFHKKMFSPESVLKCEQKFLAQVIRPAGYYNQKAIKLKHITEWFISNDYIISKKTERFKRSEYFKEDEVNLLISEVRSNLLKVHGVGPETADSILLYAYHIPTFVVDSYTKRLFQIHKIYTPTGKNLLDYQKIQKMVHSVFNQKDYVSKVKIFNEFHALIVKEGKNSVN